MPPKPIRKVATGDATGPPEGQGPGGDRTSFLKKKKKQEEEVPFHHHWRVGVHRHKGDIYVKLPGGRVEQLKGEKEELCLGVVEARHLPQMDMGADTSAEDRAAGIGVTCDAFVTVQLGEQKRKTEVVHDTLSPYFGASFVFVLTDHTDERAEIARRLSDLSVLRIEVRDWDDGGDTDFVGMCELPMEELYTKDHMDRFQYIDTWIDLCNEDGTPAKIRLDGTPARGSIRIQGAIRGGKQVEVMNRVQGRTWLEPGKLVEAVQKTQQLFQEGDREIIECMINLIHRRNFEAPHISKEHITMLDEVGVPLGITLKRPGRKDLDQTDEPLGLRLSHMIKKGVPLQSLSVHDPRDTFYNPMKTHWLARVEAISIIGKMSSRGDQRAVTAIMGTVNDEHASVRAKSVYVLSLLASLEDMEVVALLIDRIDDEDPYVRKELVNALNIIARKNDVRSVLDICTYMDSPRDEVRTTAIHCLRAAVRPGFRVAIVEACARLESPSNAIKMNALASLPLIAKKGDRVAIVEVTNRLQHPLPPVRSVALQALNLVANKGDRFALAAVGNVMEHPDYEVRRAAAQGIQLLCYPGDLAAIQVIVMRLKVDASADCVREGAKYVAAPTTGNPPGWRDPGLPQFGPKKLRGDPIVFDKILTPRLAGLMPIGREATVAFHAPVLPADSGVKTIAQMWWRDKHQKDTVRHRYEWAGPQTAQALGLSSGSRPNTSILSRPGTSLAMSGAAGSLKSIRSAAAVRETHVRSSVSDNKGVQIEIIGGDDLDTDAFAHAAKPSGIRTRPGTRDGKQRNVVLEDRVQTAASQRSNHSYGTSRTGTGHKTREQRMNEKMRDQSKNVLDVIEKGLIRELLIEKKDLDEDAEMDIAYKFPSYIEFFESLSYVLKENGELYKWWNPSLIFPAPEDKTATDADRSFPRIRTLLQFNPANAQDLRKVWSTTRQIWRRFVSASSGADPLPPVIAKKVGTLSITVKRAQYLPKMDRFGGCDSYVDLTVPGRPVKTTKVVNKLLDPHWRASFCFDIMDRDFIERIKSPNTEKKRQEETIQIEGITDDGEFEPPEGLVGLYYDQKLTLPITRTEFNGQAELTFKDVIASLASTLGSKWLRVGNAAPTAGNAFEHPELAQALISKSEFTQQEWEAFEITDLRADHFIKSGDTYFQPASKSREQVEILHSEQTAPRSRDIFFRVHTSDMLETISMAGRLSEANFQKELLRADLLDEFRLPDIVSLHLTTAETLSKVSAPVQAWIKHYQLGRDPISVGKVQLPMVPLLNSLASGDKSDLAGWFEVLTESKEGALIRQTDHHDRRTELFLEISYQQEPHKFYSDDLPEGSQRAVEGLGIAIRSLALETLCRITGPAVKQAIEEIILCATIPSPEVYATVSEALQRVAVPSHSDAATDVAWIPETNLAVSASRDGTIKVWDTEYGALVRTIRSPRGSATAIATHHLLKDVIITANSDCSFSLWDTSSGKEVFNQPFIGQQIGSLCMSLQGNAVLSVDDLHDACFKREKGQIRLWAVSQPPTLEEILENERIRDEYEKCAQALAACNPSNFPEPSRERKLVFPLIERIVMIGAPAEAAVAKVPGGLDEDAITRGRVALEDLYRKLADGNEYEYPIWIRSLALRVRRERKKSKIVQLAKLDVGDRFAKVQKKPTDLVRCIRYHPTDATCFASAGDDGVVRIWKVRENVVQQTVEKASVQLHNFFDAHPSPIHSLVFHPSFEKCLITASRTVKLWNFVAKEEILSVPVYAHHATSVDIWSAPQSVSATLVVGNVEGVIITWSLEITPIGVKITACAEERHRVGRHTGAVIALRLQKNGEECVSASRDGTIMVFHTITGDVIRHFNGDPDPQGSAPSVSAAALAEYLHNDSTHVRKMAAHALEHMAEVGDHEALGSIARKLNHSDPMIRDLVLAPLQRLTRRGDIHCIAALAGLLKVENEDVRKCVVSAVTYAVGDDASEVERLVQFADAIIATHGHPARTPCIAAAEFVLDSLDFVEGERLADFLRSWDRTKNDGMQLVMLLAAARLGELHRQRNLEGIYVFLRHTNQHVRTLAGHVLAHLCENNPEKYLWEVVTHTVVEAHSPDLETASSALDGLHAVLAGHLFAVMDKAIDERMAQNEIENQKNLTRKNRRRRTRDAGGRVSTGATNRSISSAQSRDSSALSSPTSSRPASRVSTATYSAIQP